MTVKLNTRISNRNIIIIIIIIIIVVVVLKGLGLLAYSGSEFIFLKLMNLFRQLVGLLGRGINPT